MRYFFCLLILVASTAQAAIDRKIALFQKTNQYLTNGSVTGGQSATGSSSFSILDVRRIFAAKDKVERILIEVGDDKGHPLINKLSYFQVSVEKNRPRVVINLSQTVASNVDQQKLRKLFLSSPYVKDAKINFDPVDLSMTMQLVLKKAVLLEVFEMKSKNKGSRLVVDLKG